MMNKTFFAGILAGTLLMVLFHEKITLSVPQPAQAQQAGSAMPVGPGAGQPQSQPAPAQGQTASQAASPAAQGTVQSNPNSTMGATGMSCPMMSGMGGMGGMNNMSGMSVGMGGMGHTMDQGLTMKEIVYIISMQDALQVVNDMLRIQEKLLDSQTPNKDDLRRQLAQLGEKTRKLMADYRGMLTSQVKSD